MFSRLTFFTSLLLVTSCTYSIVTHKNYEGVQVTENQDEPSSRSQQPDDSQGELPADAESEEFKLTPKKNQSPTPVLTVLLKASFSQKETGNLLEKYILLHTPPPESAV